MRPVFALICLPFLILTGCGADKTVPARARPLAHKLYGDADAGRVAMERWCISCHRANPPFTDQAAPPLASLARNADASERVIRTFLMQPHSPMPPLELSNQMIEDIVAYLRRVAGK
jgi:mono/diheme cytochrome c family protein